MEHLKTADPDEYYFLLGGYDLEMVEIRAFLEGYGLIAGRDFLDRHLSWGARLSDYAGHFHGTRINAGIELWEDIPRPARYARIDHHNELPSRPASIEQVLALFGAAPTRWQMLVAANDAGYIPALEAMGATPEEIREVRRRDRACQGVTEADEDLAEKAIAENLEETEGVAIVKALSSRFSPITDRLYGRYDQLVVFTGRELTYYGRNKSRLEKKFADWIKSGRAYSGGGDDGFWGVASGALDTQDIRQLTREIPQIVA